MPKIDDVTDDPERFEEAIAAFRKRVPISDAAWAQLTEAEREFAFKVSGAAQADLVTDAWEAIDTALVEGTTFDDFKAEVGSALEAAWGGADANRLETVFRTNTQTAYNGGRHEIMTHPEVKKAREYWRFDAVQDNRTSEVCEELDGTVRPADDPWWRSHTPPLHFNCRSIIVPLSREEAEEEGIDDDAPEVEADDGFGRAPSTGGDWDPDPSDYPSAIGDVLRGKLD